MDTNHPVPVPSDPASGAATPPVPAALQSLIDVLALESCDPQLDRDGDLVFKTRGLTFVILRSVRDPEFVRLMLPGIYTVEVDGEHATVLAAANYVNRACKAAKVYLREGNVHAAIEYFSADLGQLAPVVMRGVDALEHAQRSFDIALNIYRSN